MSVIDEPKKQRVLAGCGVMLLLIVGLPWLMCARSAKAPQGGAPALQIHTLSYEARRTPDGVVLTNTDPFDWSGVEISLNAGLMGGGFSAQCASLAAGQSVTIPWGQFANGDGLRFNPMTHKASKIKVIADTPTGQGVHNASWN